MLRGDATGAGDFTIFMDTDGEGGKTMLGVEGLGSG